MKVLHIIRSNDDRLAHKLIDEIGHTDDADQTLLMIQDGVYIRPEGLRAFACADDIRARAVETDLPLVGYDQIVDMIFEHDRVITW
ncbi:MAG: hypothetical protein JSV16_13470 [Candidatus Hydrogenedentota bacterium]|nr:MAG: hypothetical protein JSV16_13470 [Candidatus Hydrogenedentota bacterium]